MAYEYSHPDRFLPYKWLVAAAFTFGIFMDLLDITIVNVALPTLGRVFDAGPSSLEWVITGYLLSLAIWIPASGWIGDRIGTKRVFLFALAMFTAGSALCGLAWDIESLVAFRILQGVGGGMLTPVGTAMLFRAFPPHERAQASIILTVPTVIAPAVGPILGGFFVDYVSWHWIFFVNIPIGIAGFLFTLIFLQEEKAPVSNRFDVAGFILSGAGLALVLYALSQGPQAGWTSTEVLATGLTGIAMFIALVYVELSIQDPMLDLRLLSDRMFRNANIVFFSMVGGLMGVIFLLPLLLQDLRGLSAITTGLILGPQALGVAVFAPIAGKLFMKYGPRRLLAGSLVIFAITSGLFILVDLDTSLWLIEAILLARGAAMAFTFIPLQAASFATIQRDQVGQASSLFNTTRQVASAVGVAILATVLATSTKHHIGSLVAGGAAPQQAGIDGALQGFHDAFLASVIMAIVGLAFSLIINDKDAESAMRDMSGATEGDMEPVAVH